MKQRLRVKVEVPDYAKNNSFRNLYENVIEIDDSVSFDYSIVVKSLKMLYPYDNSFITFVIG